MREMKTKKQNYEVKNRRIRDDFNILRREHPEKIREPLRLSWSNWGFGLEKISDSAKRLRDNEVEYIELHGNHYGPDLGYSVVETRSVLSDYDLKVSGMCGMFTAENDLSSNSGASRQRAVDYIKRTLSFAAEVGGDYMLVVPGAVGRPRAYDDSEFERSSDTLRIVAGRFDDQGIRAAVEPIRSAEVSFCHTISDAGAYIEAVGHPGVQHINGDIYHMLSEESHLGEALIEAGDRLINLHIADTNRRALGEGSLDLDTVIMALYLIGFNRPGCYVTPEPLGPGGDPYPAMFGKPDSCVLDELVAQTVRYFRERELYVIEG